MTGAYDIDLAHFGSATASHAAKASRKPRRIGLSIGSGFHANGWPLLKWADLARALLDGGAAVTVLGGPAKAGLAKAIDVACGQPGALDIGTGTSDFGSFVAMAAGLDLVIASDGGTAHLCGLGAPILSVLGPSPYRRYAPFGSHNRLLSRTLSCSPCCQYAANLVNTCMTLECLSGSEPALLAKVALRERPSRKPSEERLQGGVALFNATSDLGREEMLHGIES